jgi:hypothetical protein
VDAEGVVAPVPVGASLLAGAVDAPPDDDAPGCTSDAESPEPAGAVLLPASGATDPAALAVGAGIDALASPAAGAGGDAEAGTGAGGVPAAAPDELVVPADAPPPAGPAPTRLGVGAASRAAPQSSQYSAPRGFSFWQT